MSIKQGGMAGMGGGPRGPRPTGGGVRQSSTRTSPRSGGKPAKKTALNTRGNKGLVPKSVRAKLVRTEKENASDRRDFGPRWSNKVGRKIKKVSRVPAVVTTRTTAGTRTSTTRTSPRVDAIKRLKVRELAVKNGKVTSFVSKQNIKVTGPKRTISDHAGSKQYPKISPEVRAKANSSIKDSVAVQKFLKSQPKPKGKIQKGSTWDTYSYAKSRSKLTSKNVFKKSTTPKNISKKSGSAKSYAINQKVQMTKRKLSRISKKGGF